MRFQWEGWKLEHRIIYGLLNSHKVPSTVELFDGFQLWKQGWQEAIAINLNLSILSSFSLPFSLLHLHGSPHLLRESLPYLPPKCPNQTTKLQSQRSFSAHRDRRRRESRWWWWISISTLPGRSSRSSRPQLRILTLRLFYPAPTSLSLLSGGFPTIMRTERPKMPPSEASACLTARDFPLVSLGWSSRSKCFGLFG